MVKDDLGLCLIVLAGRTDLSAAVLQNVLGLVSSLVISLGPMLFVLVESILVHVYMKGLSQLYSMLKV
jgi:hypothetical protein